MKWGFVGTGRIAQRIMVAFKQLPQAEVVAAYSHNAAGLKAFCEQWGVCKQYLSLDEMLQDPDIEVIYLATPHIVHFEHTAKALRAGKHVLCEKPMAMSAAETRGLVALAREKKVFFMEALWSRFFPIAYWLRECIATKALGRIYNVMADFSYHAEYDPSQRFFRKDLGGGAMRGAGIYPLSFATMVFGHMPCEVHSMSEMKNGIDLRSAAMLRFPCGGTAQLYTGFQGESVQGANIAFEGGSVWIPDFWHPQQAIVRTPDGTKSIDMPFEHPGFQFELIETMECIAGGRLESSIMPLDESIALAEVMDEMYRQWGDSDYDIH